MKETKDSRIISKKESIKFVKDLIKNKEPFFIIAVGNKASVVAVNQMDGNILLNALAVMHEHMERLKEEVAKMVLQHNQRVTDDMMGGAG